MKLPPLSELPTGLTKEPRQSRSRDRQRALLAAGLKLTETRDWETLTVADIAAVNGFSVGSFYTRFRDKQAYLEVLVHSVARQMRVHIDTYTDAIRRSGMDARGMLESFVDEAIDTYTRLRGVFRAAVLSQRRADAAAPHDEPLSRTFRDVRTYSRELFIDTVAPRLALSPTVARQRLGFAHQMMNSTLINCILTDPGPLGLADRQLRSQLVDALCAYLDIR